MATPTAAELQPRLTALGLRSLSNKLMQDTMVAYAPSITNGPVRIRFLALAAYILANPGSCYTATFNNTLTITHHPNAPLVREILKCFASHPHALRRITHVLKPLYPTITTGWWPQ